MAAERVSSIVGRRLRAERRVRGWTLAELAEKAGVSKGLIGQLERGVGNPSLENLHKLTQVLGLPPTALFDEEYGNRPSPVFSGPPPQVGVVRAGARKLVSFPHDRVVYELLTPDFRRALEVFRCLLPADYDSSAAPLEHEGEECVYLVRGRVEANIGEETFVLEEGDSIGYPATSPHWWRNLGDAEAELICVVTPPSL